MTEERRRAWDEYAAHCPNVLFRTSCNTFESIAAKWADALLAKRDERFPVEAERYTEARIEQRGYADGCRDERLRIAAMAREWAKDYREPPRRDFAAQVLDAFASHLESERP